MFRSFITIAAVAGLVAGASAQQQVPAANVHQAMPVQYGSFDFENGFTATTGVGRTSGPDTIFGAPLNSALYYWSTPGGGTKQEWSDEAFLANRGVTTVENVNGITWGYCEGTGVSYFDATVRFYNDHLTFTGPSNWTPGFHSFANCEYLVTGLPGMGGCWYVTVDLSNGNECVLPDSTNPLSLAEGTIGWSVVADPAGYYSGPLLGKLGNAPAGSADQFQWQDRPGNFWGAGAYYNAGAYYFGGGSHLQANFDVNLYATPEDTSYCYNTRTKDILSLELTDGATSAGATITLKYTVAGTSGAARATMMVEKDQAIGGVAGCEQVGMGAPAGSAFTRQVGFPPLWRAPASVPVGDGAFTVTIGSLPSALPAGTRVILELVQWNGPSGYTVGQVDAVSNGVDLRM